MSVVVNLPAILLINGDYPVVSGGGRIANV